MNAPELSLAVKTHFSAIKQLMFSLTGYRLDQIAAKQGKKYFFIFTDANGQYLAEVAKIMADSLTITVIDPHHFNLNQAQEAFKHVRENHPNGKVIFDLR